MEIYETDKKVTLKETSNIDNITEESTKETITEESAIIAERKIQIKSLEFVSNAFNYTQNNAVFGGIYTYIDDENKSHTANGDISLGIIGDNQVDVGAKEDKIVIKLKTDFTDRVNDLEDESNKCAYSLGVSIDTATYIMTLELKNKNDEIIDTKTVDLPLEEMIVSASYDTSTKELVLTLKSGQTLRISIADLVSGLATSTELEQLKTDLEDGNITVMNAEYAVSATNDSDGNNISTTYAKNDNLPTVAKSGSYNDLTDKPIIPEGARLYNEFGQNTDGSITQKFLTENVALTTDIPTKTSDLTNDSGFVSDVSSKMDKENPTGTGSFSLNRNSAGEVGDYSFVEGNSCIASGTRAHAEGYATGATGEDSHAEGTNSIASGTASHAEGYVTTANHLAQHVFGMNNVADDSSNKSNAKGNYIEIVGNGTTTKQSNARTLDWSGNEVLAGTSQATGFKTASGTSSQFLKADGSVDETSYSTFSGSYNDLSDKPTSITGKTLELGGQDGTASAAFIDFHTDGSSETDYNARILVSRNSNIIYMLCGGLNINGYQALALQGRYASIETSSTAQGYIDFYLASGSKLRFAYGYSKTTSVTFSTPFTTILWANTSDASTADTQSQRTTLSSISTTGFSCKSSGSYPIRWEAWGII